MKQPKTIQFLLLFTLLALWASGCATQNVNPPQARANTGYVDFHAGSANELCWQVECFDERAQSFKKVFSELEPPAGGFLRLAFAPGHQRLRVTVLNRVIARPAEVEVEVPDGNIIPVRVTLTPAGTALVETREVSHGGTAKGRYGRRTKYGSDETTMFQLRAEAELPTSYRVKEQTSYVR
jgi:hypothetical protein